MQLPAGLQDTDPEASDTVGFGSEGAGKQTPAPPRSPEGRRSGLQLPSPPPQEEGQAGRWLLAGEGAEFGDSDLTNLSLLPPSQLTLTEVADKPGWGEQVLVAATHPDTQT